MPSMEDCTHFVYVQTSDCYGRIHAAYNPDKKDATLEEALIAKNKIELYIPEENRVYKNKRALDWHIRYIKSQQNTKTKKILSISRLSKVIVYFC